MSETFLEKPGSQMSNGGSDRGEKQQAPAIWKNPFDEH